MAEEWAVYGTVTHVIDGDTVSLQLDLGWKVALADEPVRIAGINAPELRSAAGPAARDFLAELLPLGARVRVVSKRWGGEREKYGRALAAIEGPAGDVAAAMIAAGHAVAWDGKGKRP